MILAMSLIDQYWWAEVGKDVSLAVLVIMLIIRMALERRKP